jgi:hypothetical protein
MLYEKLPSRSSTRLMRLLPGAADDPLACRPDIVELDSDDVDYLPSPTSGVTLLIKSRYNA